MGTEYRILTGLKNTLILRDFLKLISHMYVKTDG